MTTRPRARRETDQLRRRAPPSRGRRTAQPQSARHPVRVARAPRPRPPATSLSPAGALFAVALPCAGASASAGDHLLELAIVQDLVLAHFEQRLERLLLQMAQRVDERFLERDHHRRVVAVRAAGRLA